VNNLLNLPIVILISGNGSNLQAIIDAIEIYNLPVQIKAVISNNPNAYGLKRALGANLPIDVLSPDDFIDGASYDNALSHAISRYSPALIVLAGFMRILGPICLEKFKNQIVNIHPSLLPHYPGLNTHALAIANSALEHGCSVHFVNEQLDGGPLIAQASVKVMKEETIETLKEKVHQAEHFLYPTVLNWFAHQRIALITNHVFIDNIQIPTCGLQFAF
jgi:phosphoribosylglycinamide formyltransferase 1